MRYKTVYLMDMSYGFRNVFKNRLWHISSGGLCTWVIYHDGTIEGKRLAMIEKKDNAVHIKRFLELVNEQPSFSQDDKAIISQYGSWFTFSVIDKGPDEVCDA